MPIVWRDGMALGFDTIDNDHKKLISTINEFEACPDFAHAEAAAKRLFAYTQEHFKREEGLQQMFRYPHAHEHKDEHDAILAKLKDVIRTHFLGKHSADEEREAIAKMAALMHDWIMGHVLKTDIKMKPYLNT